MEKKKLAVFDVDGTIFRKNLHFELIDELVYRKIFDYQTRKELLRVYGKWLDNEGSYEEYRNRLIRLYEEKIKGCNQDDIIQAANSVAKFNAKRIYIFAKKSIEKLKSTHFMLMISGSPVEIVEKYAQILKFDAFFGSIYELDKNKKYTGKEIFTPVKDKGMVVKQFAAEHGISLKDSFGMGDTESDAKFLKLVEKPIAFNPNLNLKKIAEESNWKIAIEKKDVIYNIN